MAGVDLRFLHFVLKIGNRRKAVEFLRDKLRMKVLRHEEFSEGCEATCNGPYAGRWSKTMIGYGPEDDHFVLELTYNYGVPHYDMGNDFRSMTISYGGGEGESLKEAKLEGYTFFIPPVLREGENPTINRLSLSCSNLTKTREYWTKYVGLNETRQQDATGGAVTFRGKPDSVPALELEFVEVEQVDRAKAFGRIAFSCPGSALEGIEKKLKDAGQTILTPLISLDTPGKATVQVVIAADPDGHEICFVGDEGFRSLSAVDPDANAALDKDIARDKSSTGKME